jgi:S-adenosylmethionine synthetase
MSIYISKKDMREPLFEFVERKGKGHPDTLSDALAERLSANYSKYTRDNFGAVLHHNFDKVGLLGGASFVQFGKGKMTEPIRVLLNGRASTKFGNTKIPLKEMLIKWSTEFIVEHFPMINPNTDLDFHYNQSNKSSPGKTDEKDAEKGTRKYWFEPRDLNDLQELKHLVSNDTSLGVGYAPYSKLEQLVLTIEGKLNGDAFKKSYPWIGSDIKVMAFRHKEQYDITLCIPQISTFVHNIDEYKKNIAFCRKTIEKIAKKAGIKNLNLYINTRDNFETLELYLTATGSSIESGDEGLVGRGNRINGVISPMRLMSMEGACGKNPVYHIGKVYYVAANEISKKIYKKFGVANEVALVSQSGRDLLDPWITFIALSPSFTDTESIRLFVEKELKNIPTITNLLIEQKVQLY